MIIDSPLISTPVDIAGPSIPAATPPAGRKFWLKILLFLTAFCSCFAAHAQFNSGDMRGGGGGGSNDGIGITLMAGMDAPMHNLKEAYKPALSFDLGAAKGFSGFILGVNVGYRAYQPKYSNYYLDDTDPDAGTVSFSNFSVISIYSSAKYNLELTDHLLLYGGVNVGTYIVNYSYRTQNSYLDNQESNTSSYSYIAPKIGINFALSESIRLGLEGRYNLFGGSDYYYNSRDGESGSGQFYTSAGGGITLTYQFPE